MALITKPPAWAYCTTSLPASPSTIGTQVTAGANNADAAAVSLISSLTHDVEYIVIYYHGYNVSTGNGSALLDILVDPAGGTSWTSLIEDLLVGYTSAASASIPFGSCYHFPVWLKSGHSIGARARTAHTANITTGRVSIYAFGGNANPASWWCGQTVTSIATTPASSQGTAHTPGNSGAYSTWTNLGSTLPYNTGAVQFAVHGVNTDTTATNLNYYYEFGVGGVRLGAPIFRAVNNVEAGFMVNPAPVFCNLAAGTQLQVRGTCSGTAEIPDVAAYAVS